MKKIILSFLFLGFYQGFKSQAVVNDSIELQPNYTNEVYYRLANGGKVSSVSNAWDIQIFSSLFSASFRVNSGFGVSVYLPVNTDTTGFSSTTLDTTGMVELRDGLDRWENDAFTSIQTGHPNYGWGNYQGMGLITGDKTFVIKLTSGVYKKVLIERINPTGPAVLYFADLDGSNFVSKSINRNTYATKHHVYYDVEGDNVIDAEPTKANWDIVFRKYKEEVIPGLFYDVVGGLLNYSTKVAEVRNVSVADARSAWTSYTMDSTLNIVGSDWKMFNNGTFMWEIEDSLSYFMKDANQDVYQVVFTSFEGAASGKFHFTKELMSTAGLTEIANVSSVSLYPNPAREEINLLIDTKKEMQVEWTILSINGVVVKKETNQALVQGLNQGVISISDLDKGMYVLAVTQNGNLLYTKRFSKI